jgi:hypothetical protein
MGADPHAQPVAEQDPRTYTTFETTQIQEQLQRLPELVLACIRHFFKLALPIADQVTNMAASSFD